MQTRLLSHICRTDASNTLTNLVNTPRLGNVNTHLFWPGSFPQKSGN